MRLLSYKNDTKELSFIGSDFPFSFSIEYNNFICNTSTTFFILEYNNCFAPIIIRKNKFLSVIQFQFRPLNKEAKNLLVIEETDFLNEACAFIKKNKLAHRICQPANYALFFTTPEGSIKAPFGTYEITLSSNTKEELLANMQPRYRTVIRATEKSQPIIKTGEQELIPFWELYKETMNRTGMYFEPFEVIKKMFKKMPAQILVANCYSENKIQGGVFIVYTHYGAYYLHGASAQETESDGAIKYLHYWCMNYFKGKNILKYDFVGARLSNVKATKLEGIQNFKKRFGSNLIQGWLWKKDIFPFTCLAYDSLLNLKLKIQAKTLPKDIIDQERRKLHES